MTNSTCTTNNPYHTVCQMIRSAVNTLQLSDDVYQILAKPVRMLEVSIPVRMDDGKIVNYTGYRCQHSDLLGPSKGGIRFHPEVTADQVRALATWMSLKTSISDLPYSGGKGGVVVDAKKLSTRELELLSRGYIRAIASFIGPEKDIPAPDVNTNPQVMGWMTDEYHQLSGHNVPAFITGKPLILGGSHGRVEATGSGVFITIVEAAKKLSLELDGATAAIQGFGNVGSIVAKCLDESNVKIVAISGSQGGIHNASGLPLAKLHAHIAAGKPLTDFADATMISNEELLTLDVDILVPAALGNQITEQNASEIKAKIVAEGANGPTTAGGDEILNDRNIFVIPEILSNAGGVIVSHLEWVQNKAGYYWSAEQVQKELQTKLTTCFANVFDIATLHKVSMRQAAYILAVKRLTMGMQARGIVV